MSTSGEPCTLHDLRHCGVCDPPPVSYRKGATPVDVPPGHYVEIQPGTGAYHRADCYMVTADWDGAGTAKLGKRVPRSPHEIRDRGLRPAQCCEPPLLRLGPQT